MDVSEVIRLKLLEDENGRLKRLLAGTMLDNGVLKAGASKKLVRPVVQRKAVEQLR